MSKYPIAAIMPLVAFWKNDILPLKDWDIQCDFRRSWEMKSNGDHGNVEIVEVKRAAFIKLLDPRDADPNEMQRYDPEIALVHELLHCCFAPFTREEIDEHWDIVQEQAVHAMSLALVALRRRFRAGPGPVSPRSKTRKKAAALKAVVPVVVLPKAA